GHERAPAALRAAGLIERLRAAGYEVADLGDCATQLYQPDDEHPRARNLPPVLAALNDLKPRVEQAVKSGALPLVLGGDCIIVLATLAGVRRYYRNISLVYFDRDADMNVPATTPSGCVDGMAVSHVVGRGAPELVRFWGEPPLVREPDVALFGVERLDPPEEVLLARSPIRRYVAGDVARQGAAAAAETALERVHVSSHEYVLHFDVDAISSDDFRATNYVTPGGLRLEEVRQALEVFVRQKNLAAVEVTAYNPELDPDGNAAKLLVELLGSVFAARLEALAHDDVPATEAAASTAAASVTSASGGAAPAAPAGSESPGVGAAEPSTAQPTTAPETPTATSIEPESPEGAHQVAKPAGTPSDDPGPTPSPAESESSGS
ncbi:MAG: arginase family protein, partial [Candidatus Acidiferrales bacterium]